MPNGRLMTLPTPESVAAWTEAGRDDSAADISVTSEGQIVLASTQPLCWLAIRWNLSMSPGARVLGDAWERGYGDLEWRGVVTERPLPWYALIHSPDGTTTGWGVKTGAGSLASWRVDATGITLVLDVRNGGSGVQLGGRKLNAAQVVSLESQPGENSFAFAIRFCRALCDTPKLPIQPVYGGNDWYFRYGQISEDTVKADAGLLRQLSPSRTNAPFFVIDDGWFARDNPAGPYTSGNAKFPDLPGLAAWMKSQDVRPGIWMRPLLTEAAVPDTWRLSRDKTYLDPSVPEVLELVHADIARLSDWGYELIKHDFSTFDITGGWGFHMGGSMTRNGWAFADRTRTTAEIIRALYQTIRDAAGSTYLIGCNTIGHLGAGLFELQRTGDDTSGRHWERTRKMGVNTLAFRLPQHDTLFAADADCVGLTPDVPWEKNRQWLDVVARSGTPLFVSADPNAIGPEQRAALEAAFAQAAESQPTAEPLDWLENTCPRHWRFGVEEVTYDWDDFSGSAHACPA